MEWLYRKFDWLYLKIGIPEASLSDTPTHRFARRFHPPFVIAALLGSAALTAVHSLYSLSRPMPLDERINLAGLDFGGTLFVIACIGMFAFGAAADATQSEDTLR